jgi:aminoglycoside phosphotransferase family enzyme/predicted kinase
MLASATDGFAVERLLQRDAFPHEVTVPKLLETHISWVILTGPFAYKIKKPVKFDFVDYSSLELRKKYCLQEIELNRRFAPEIYLDVVPIIKTGDAILVGSKAVEETGNELGEPIEYAVKMREFSQDAIVAARLQNPELTSEVVDQFGSYVAQFHDSIERANPTIECVQAECIAKDALENFATVRDAFQDEIRSQTLDRLERWTVDQLEILRPKFEQRLHAGHVRRCHGDMHLKNIVQREGQLSAFDGIEFNEEFQWIDVLSEIAFPVMDFIARGRPDLGWRLLNAYLESTGDYVALDVLRFYLVYRALVRAKVTWLNPANRSLEAREKYQVEGSTDDWAGPWDKYLAAAHYFAFELRPKLAITHGFSGSGKSTVALQVMENEGWVRLRSDVERQRLAKQFKAKDSYSSAMTDWVYAHLGELARAAIEAGLPVIVDATFLNLKRRAQFESMARDLNLEFQIITCDAPFNELCRRLRERGPDPSEATVDVLKRQMETHDPLTTDELQYVRDGLGHPA